MEAINLADLHGAPLLEWSRITDRTLSVATQEFDLVVEGDARRVTAPAPVAALAERWAADGWPARVDDTGSALTAPFSAPSAGPAPRFVYGITPHRATALLAVDTGGATRWRF